MCEHGVFPIFLENDHLKVNKILGLTFFKARKDLERFKTAFFHLLQLSLVLDGLFTTPVHSPKKPFCELDQRFLTRTFGPKIEVYL